MLEKKELALMHLISTCNLLAEKMRLGNISFEEYKTEPSTGSIHKLIYDEKTNKVVRTWNIMKGEVTGYYDGAYLDGIENIVIKDGGTAYAILEVTLNGTSDVIVIEPNRWEYLKMRNPEGSAHNHIMDRFLKVD